MVNKPRIYRFTGHGFLKAMQAMQLLECKMEMFHDQKILLSCKWCAFILLLETYAKSGAEKVLMWPERAQEVVWEVLSFFLLSMCLVITCIFDIIHKSWYLVQHLFLMNPIWESKHCVSPKDTALSKITWLGSSRRSNLSPPISHILNQFNVEVCSVPTFSSSSTSSFMI